MEEHLLKKFHPKDSKESLICIRKWNLNCEFKHNETTRLSFLYAKQYSWYILNYGMSFDVDLLTHWMSIHFALI